MNNRPRGFTLLELVVVLAILAVVTGMAVASFTAVEDQTRFDATTRLVEDVEIAILGERSLRNANNQPLINGFVADMGRLPVSLDLDGLPATPPLPSELWSPVIQETPTVVTLDAYAMRPAIAGNISAAYSITPNSLGAQTLTALPSIPDASDQNVFLGTGWRGPYLRLGAGQSKLLDSWSNSVGLLDGTNNITAVNNPVFGILSLGSDNLLGGADSFARDQSFNVFSPSDRYRGTVLVNVKTNTALTSSGTTITVQMFVPDNGKFRCFQMTHTSTTIANQVVQFYFPTEATLSSVPLNVSTIGSRVIKAYLGAKTTPTQTGSSLTVTLTPGQNNVSLELP